MVTAHLQDMPAAATTSSPSRRDWRGDAMRRRVARRYARERRFRMLGLAAVIVATGFLAFLMVMIVGTGAKGFQRAEVPVDISYDAARLGIDPDSAVDLDAEIVRADTLGLVAETARTQLGSAGIVSEGAWLAVRDRLRENPALLGQTERLWLVAAPGIDLLAKGNVDFSTSPDRRPVSQDITESYRRLLAEDRVRLAFNTGFLGNANSTSAEQAGIWGAFVGSILTMLVTLGISFPLGVMTAVYLEEYAP
ncbi:MAG: DUF3333 domain-containing protein, partial [Pseudomonadota bacterium]